MSRAQEIEAAANLLARSLETACLARLYESMDSGAVLKCSDARDVLAAAAALRRALALPADSETCVWRQDGGHWLSGCGSSLYVESRTAAAIGLVNCPFCNKRIEDPEDHTGDGGA